MEPKICRHYTKKKIMEATHKLKIKKMIPRYLTLSIAYQNV